MVLLGKCYEEKGFLDDALEMVQQSCGWRFFAGQFTAVPVPTSVKVRSEGRIAAYSKENSGMQSTIAIHQGFAAKSLGTLRWRVPLENLGSKLVVASIRVAGLLWRRFKRWGDRIRACIYAEASTAAFISHLH